MGDIHSPALVLPLLAAFSRYDEALAWGRARAESFWGPVALESLAFDFVETDYYQASMGPGLKKQFFAFQKLADPGELIAWKLTANAWEAEYSSLARHAEPRPLNLDPGYVAPGKLVLASTKDFAHRIYLGQGIYAEVTLHFRQHRWEHHQWTFPDYRRADYQAFFSRCREQLLGRRLESRL
jgi:hypothetical protein